ncbi:CYTH domain-containing protein [Phragmitibacter flavus]|uniref:CYTH domain-containing protein n=2 Tax=Phragmitibacter flavus TaxID=2576071 RepID=A0A5R8KHP1_9BACT|nr:CYTH domain-containing protein [Phragmitibacter flavus]
MPVEIERKFLVASDAWREGASGTMMKQGYLARDPDRTVRIRIAGENAFVTIKGRRSGLARDEFEYAIPLSDAEELLRLCLPPLIEKTRFIVLHAGNRWEVDEFYGDNAGLIVAELELPSEDAAFEKPSWLGAEVSDDPRYFNSRLAQHQFKDW